MFLVRRNHKVNLILRVLWTSLDTQYKDRFKRGNLNPESRNTRSDDFSAMAFFLESNWNKKLNFVFFSEVTRTFIAF